MVTSVNSRGYTLIELLVAISIGIIVFTIGFAGYREFSRRQALTGIVKQIKADLRLAQQLALTGQKPTVGSCVRLDGYSFTRTSPTSYQLIANCTNANRIVKDITISPNTTITAGTVIFKVLGQGTNLTAPLTFTITNSLTGTSGNIIIGIGGDIK